MLCRSRLVFFYSKLISLLNLPPARMASNIRSDENPLNHAPGLLSIFTDNPKRLQRINFLNKLYEDSGFKLRIAGGAVRDILRGVAPTDIDFATTARPEQSLDILMMHEDLLRIIVTTAGQKHGTVAVKFKEGDLNSKRVKLDPKSQCDMIIPKENPEYDNESPYEITTLRCDDVTDGRHAEVKFIEDWKLDAERRDLTINAMFLTLDKGEIVDYYNGKSDLKDGIVRFVGDADKRIKEDYLRILRFFRFWNRYGGHKRPEERTLDTIKSNLEGLDLISGERIWVEVKKVLVHHSCREAVKLMLELQVFKSVGVVDANVHNYDLYCKEVLEQLVTVEENILKYFKNFSDVSKTQLDEYNKLKDLTPVMLFATITQTLEMFTSAHSRLKLSNRERDTILYILENRDLNTDLDAIKYQLAICPISERCTMLNRMRSFLIYKGQLELINQISTWEVPTFPINGKLVSMEVKKRKLPGSAIQKTIAATKDRWAASDYKLSEEELLQFAKDFTDEMLAASSEKQDKKEK